LTLGFAVNIESIIRISPFARTATPEVPDRKVAAIRAAERVGYKQLIERGQLGTVTPGRRIARRPSTLVVCNCSRHRDVACGLRLYSR